MYFFTHSLEQVDILLPFILSLLINALPSNLEERADLATCENDNQDESPTSDGPTTDKSLGIGVEFESWG